MSASKLIIHKIDAGEINFKFLEIGNDDIDNKYGTKYSEWSHGKFKEKMKDPDKASRLVVKIVSGKTLDGFNLDSNAKEINAAETSIINIIKYPIQQKALHNIYTKIDENQQKCENYYNEVNTNVTVHFQSYLGNGTIKDEAELQYYLQNLSPLEHSLEKVKENNARIMENIHMLNRTLNYTKKKEILDIVYPKSLRSYSCNACGKCFVYETGLRRHYAMRHTMTKVQPRWQVVWTCIQCFQVWPRQDQALSHSNECCKSKNAECVREIKTSSLLQCEFCEKVFTSIPRLLRHSKAHTTSTNYKCNACERAFSSYKLAEQHWDSCAWMKMYYTFSLPKLLLCNSCDRKFRTYEQLYNHRYKVDHFMTKTHCNPYNIKSIGTSAYQCEMCGAWYPSVGPLKAHKIQYHPKHEIAMQCKMERNINDQNCYTLHNELTISQSEKCDIQISRA